MGARRVALFVVFLAGCNRSSVAPVSGRITLDGLPLADAIVLFQPIETGDNPGSGSVAKTDADGRYVLRQIQPDRLGASVGKHRVHITMKPTPGATESRPQKERWPAIYISKTTLDCTVPPGGKDDANFALFTIPP
jgi:hypothetical protein